MSRFIVKINQKYALWSKATGAPVTDFLSRRELAEDLMENFRYSREEIHKLFWTFQSDTSFHAVRTNRAGPDGVKLTPDELLREYGQAES